MRSHVDRLHAAAPRMWCATFPASHKLLFLQWLLGKRGTDQLHDNRRCMSAVCAAPAGRGRRFWRSGLSSYPWHRWDGPGCAKCRNSAIPPPLVKGPLGKPVAYHWSGVEWLPETSFARELRTHDQHIDLVSALVGFIRGLFVGSSNRLSGSL